MHYLLAAVGVITIAVLLWRVLSSERGDTTPTHKAAPVAPDDDPDFLRKLSEEQRRKRRDDEQN
ncbi:hypothetical protein SAMN06265360_11514 [Haloechinothrix alba]|uniref:Uncharacterized protein n=1 Tax=Haloechinothrix alba TaxID=664784 RepID=A0A238YEV9_9PSEU|nr:hypothetical protein [Haloechinothrix alba]SNR69687.1 hypothetical protein SAMN06265360_11514 [Haloechinothrix alba]